MADEATADAAAAEALGVGEDEAEGQAPDVETAATDGQDPEAAAEPSDIDSLPEWAQAEIRKARREAAASRVKAREAEQAAMSETDKVRAEVRQEYAEKLAASEVRGALSDIKPDHVDDILESLNLAKFVTDDGDVDRPAVKAFAARVLGARRARADVGAGAGTNGASKSRSTAQQFADALNPLM